MFTYFTKESYMNWQELLTSRGYNKAGRCAGCGGWFKWSDGVHLIRTKASFAKLKVNGDGKISNDTKARLQLVKLKELENYL